MARTTDVTNTDLTISCQIAPFCTCNRVQAKRNYRIRTKSTTRAVPTNRRFRPNTSSGGNKVGNTNPKPLRENQKLLQHCKPKGCTKLHTSDANTKNSRANLAKSTKPCKPKAVAKHRSIIRLSLFTASWKNRNVSTKSGTASSQNQGFLPKSARNGAFRRSGESSGNGAATPRQVKGRGTDLTWVRH